MNFREIWAFVMRDLVAWGALVVSLLAVVISVVSTAKSYRLQKRILSIEVQRETDRLKQSKAAQIKPATKRRDPYYILTVTNVGHATARNIKIRIDNTPIATCPFVFSGPKQDLILAPGASVDYCITTSKGAQFPSLFVATWDDETMLPGSVETTISWI